MDECRHVLEDYKKQAAVSGSRRVGGLAGSAVQAPAVSVEEEEGELPTGQAGHPRGGVATATARAVRPGQTAAIGG